MMKTIVLMKSAFLVAAMCLLGTAGCSDDDEAGSSSGTPAAAYPREVAVEYKVTSTSGLTTANVLYVNESGGMASEENVALPFSKKLTRSVKQYDSLGLSVTSKVGGSLTAEILVDGSSVDSKDFSGTSTVSGTVPYVFP